MKRAPRLVPRYCTTYNLAGCFQSPECHCCTLEQWLHWPLAVPPGPNNSENEEIWLSHLAGQKSALSVLLTRTWEVSAVPATVNYLLTFHHIFRRCSSYFPFHVAENCSNLARPVRVRGRVTGSESMMSWRSCSTSWGPTWCSKEFESSCQALKLSPQTGGHLQLVPQWQPGPEKMPLKQRDLECCVVIWKHWISLFRPKSSHGAVKKTRKSVQTKLLGYFVTHKKYPTFRYYRPACVQTHAVRPCLNCLIVIVDLRHHVDHMSVTWCWSRRCRRSPRAWCPRCLVSHSHLKAVQFFANPL